VDTDNGDANYGHDGQYSVIEIQRGAEKKGHEDEQNYPLRLGTDDGHILGIALVEDPAG
ncbi:MAG TPA: hypothetical protein G4O14_03420, partial [Anaerolineae bacterium]|nr:hypothetical protein [Anaerolineae bacterium]